MNWYLYPICVPFGNINYDTLYNGSHDLDLQTLPNTPITCLLSGTISSITRPTWGMQVGVKLDKPFNNIQYMSYLHLAAVRTDLMVGSHIKTDDLIGWSGGANAMSQYQGTANPTGENFLNTPDQSSQPQTGIALMYGPEYGVGSGWTQNPDPSLNPTVLIYRARAAYDTWNSLGSVRWQTGISADWFERYLYGQLMPPPQGNESHSINWSGQACVVQEFGPYRYEWDGQPRLFKY